MRRPGLLLGASLLTALGIAYTTRRFTRVAVSGHSMDPTMRDGDWLIVDRRARPVPGSVVVARDPRSVGRLIVKRVRDVGPDSQLVLESDHPAHADELIGPVGDEDVLGLAVLRYWPPSRARPIS